ncbi:hypothetical protein DSL64_28510 [Dyadobacter luteus]|uniref:Uncharacterized protein n=1 Tax=Dyadobacter luteus TaxID=2259619 RepID=A0A3D8Y2A0_9BACT|nr:T9SS type A sorting domain-containing protein [Dyadobacter luteus]REA55191.1 hypothetical protein DSL64_28510 [Dyadobacter luteus]
MKVILHTCRKLAFVLLLNLICFVSYSQSPFACQDGVSYIVKTSGSVSTLYQVTLVPNYSETVVGVVRTSANAGIAVDAIGYNVKDNFIYGFEPGTTNIVRIGASGISERLPVVSGLPASSAARQFTAGDVDANGNLFLYAAAATSMYRVNLSTQPFTAVALNGAAANLTDMSVNDAGTQVYGYSAGNGVLVLRDISSNTYTQTTTASNVGLTVQNTFYDKYGRLFAQRTTGEIFMVAPANLANTDGMVKLSGNNPPANSDGAHCRNASVYDESAQPSFDCNEGKAYFITHGSNGECSEFNTNTNLATIDTENFSRTDLTNITNGIQSGLINGIGFNPLDGYIWGYRFGTGHLARIGSDGSVQYFGISGIPWLCGGVEQTSIGAGDITADGIYYGFQGNKATGEKTLFKIDLNPASATYLQIVGTFSINALSGISISDIAFNPVDKNFYGVGGGKVYRINSNSGAVTDLGGNLSNANSIAAFCDPEGNFYFQASGSPLYKIARVHSATATMTPTVASSTAVIAAGNGDAARCPLTFFAGIKLSGNVWNDLNQDRIKSGGEVNTVTNDPSQTLTVYLINDAGVIVGKADVLDDGSWQMPSIPEGSYTLTLSNDATHAVSSPAAAIVEQLPDYWVHTGINFGTAGPAGSWSGPVTVTTSDSDKSNLNFGIRDNAAVITGTVFIDANGNGNIDPAESGSNIGSSDLTIYLVDNNGIVVDKASVDPATGAYSLTGSQGSSYTVVLSNNSNIAIGDDAPSASLPSGATMPYVNTRESYGSGNGSGAGLDPVGTPGVIAVTLTATTVTGVNFGVNSIPVANDVNNPGLANSDFSSTPPAQFPQVANYVSIPYQGLLPMNGEDREDGDLQDENNTVTFTTVNSNTLLYYNNGSSVIPVTAGTVIGDFDPEKLVIYGAVGSGDVSNPLGFTFTLVDAAGAESTPAVYTLSSSGSLPVKLLRFSAKSEAKVAVISWASSEEMNSERFDIERSIDARNWATIGSVAANGESNGVISYQFIDQRPAGGENLYRLKMVDIDGTFAFSKISSVRFEPNLYTSFFPNPASDILKVKWEDVNLNDVSKVQLFAQSGTLAYAANKLEQGQINVKHVPSGTYTLVITLKNGASQNAKIVIVH